ncbi:MAG: tetraacyldisaccharide 4'-kinase [Burkholderiales bacterium]|nr:tetraacyldisaccharide 4'-kinase [Burkholderiales bacterium]
MAWLYRGALALRGLSFALGLRRAQRAPVPVIVVGNLVAGGAGKTPTVIALVQALQAAGHRPGVISRGHGRRDTATRAVRDRSTPAEVGDEPLLIRRRTAVPTWVGARRIDAARALCAAHPEVDLIVADDGLQHRALARDVQVVVFDERGIGNGRLLPAGPLREPMPRHLPVNTHVLYNAAQPSTRWAGPCAERRLAGAVRLQAWWSGVSPSPEALATLRGHRVVAAAGMAAPQRFFAMLEAAGLALDPLPLPDHYAFATPPWPAQATDVLLTEKDAVKLLPAADARPRLWVVGLDFRLPDGFVANLLDNLQRVTRR